MRVSIIAGHSDPANQARLMAISLSFQYTKSYLIRVFVQLGFQTRTCHRFHIQRGPLCLCWDSHWSSAGARGLRWEICRSEGDKIVNNFWLYDSPEAKHVNEDWKLWSRSNVFNSNGGCNSLNGPKHPLAGIQFQNSPNHLTGDDPIWSVCKNTYSALQKILNNL